MNSVFVTNQNPFHHTDRYDGEDYYFPPKEKVLVPTDAARHMFGYQLVDKTETLVRLGWATRYDKEVKNYVENVEGVRQLANFVFEEAVMVPRSPLVEALPGPLTFPEDNLEIA